jgi:hypothetical protein
LTPFTPTAGGGRIRFIGGLCRRDVGRRLRS